MDKLSLQRKGGFLLAGGLLELPLRLAFSTWTLGLVYAEKDIVNL